MRGRRNDKRTKEKSLERRWPDNLDQKGGVIGQRGGAEGFYIYNIVIEEVIKLESRLAIEDPGLYEHGRSRKKSWMSS